jgi:hypothetical protein
VSLDLHLAAAHVDGKVVVSLSKPGWSSPVPRREVGVGAGLHGVRAVDLDAEDGHAGLAAEVAHQGEESSSSCGVGSEGRMTVVSLRSAWRVKGKPALAKIRDWAAGA